MRCDAHALAFARKCCTCSGGVQRNVPLRGSADTTGPSTAGARPGKSRPSLVINRSNVCTAPTPPRTPVSSARNRSATLRAFDSWGQLASSLTPIAVMKAPLLSPNMDLAADSTIRDA
eukprot:scaffold14040_cov31-Tisochrysis_lutea.AAC.1